VKQSKTYIYSFISSYKSYRYNIPAAPHDHRQRI